MNADLAARVVVLVLAMYLMLTERWFLKRAGTMQAEVLKLRGWRATTRIATDADHATEVVSTKLVVRLLEGDRRTVSISTKLDARPKPGDVIAVRAVARKPAWAPFASMIRPVSEDVPRLRLGLAALARAVSQLTESWGIPVGAGL